MRLLGKILREARDTEVWRFTTPEDVVRLWPKLVGYLGRRRPFWEFLLGQWKAQGLLGDAPPGGPEAPEASAKVRVDPPEEG